MQKILILGGTNFIGRNLLEQLISSTDYDLTIANRGTTNPSLFPKLKRIIGDRNTNEFAALISGHWDYIIDVSCYFPRSLERILSSSQLNLINTSSFLPAPFIAMKKLCSKMNWHPFKDAA